jgi:hypothetical protein
VHIGTATGARPGRATVTCRDAAGGLLLRVPFFSGAEQFHSYVRLRVLRPAGLPSPVVMAIAFSPGGSDAQFETALLAEQGDRLVDFWPAHWATTIQDEICVGALGPEKPVGVAVFTHIWGGAEEWHYSVHRYIATVRPWQDGALGAMSEQESRRRADDWSAAARAMGFRCRGELHTFRELDAFR